MIVLVVLAGFVRMIGRTVVVPFAHHVSVGMGVSVGVRVLVLGPVGVAVPVRMDVLVLVSMGLARRMLVFMLVLRIIRVVVRHWFLLPSSLAWRDLEHTTRSAKIHLQRSPAFLRWFL
ncbi:MAG TPA: hypothetical protein VLT85_04865 [Terriglobales bacterium]|nr:hypothetical protein [Terriglobales bacterium]